MDSQSQDHPLLLELNSLKSALARFQDEAHASAVKLQRHSLDRANTHERAVSLARENDYLKAEIAILRANPIDSNSSNSTVEQVQQLTLSLRRLSEKLTLTEDALSSKTIELLQANAGLLKARLAVESAYEVGARVRGREEAAKLREHDLEWRLKSAEEEKRIAEVAVGEYANLVRSMEARMNLGSTSTLVSPDGTNVEEDSAKHHSGETIANSLSEGKLGLQRLLSEFQSDTEELKRQLGQLRGELEVVKSNHEAERKGTHILHLEQAKTQAELQKLRIDDNTAARMVSRYMQFSQISTNNLQSTLSALKTRHAATLSTLSSTSYSLASNLRSSESTIERLRTSLDVLGGEMMKETYGRRREVALRVKLLGREEKMLEGLRRWLRKGEEALSDAENEAEDSQGRTRAALLGMTQDARILLEGLDDGFVTDSASLSGSLARVVLAQGLVDGLVEELKMETVRRMDLEKAVLQGFQPIETLNGYEVNQRQLVSEEQGSSPNLPCYPSAPPPPSETTTDLPHESEPLHFEKAQSNTTILIDTVSTDTNTPDMIPNPTTKGDPIPLDPAPLSDDTAAHASDLSPSSSSNSTLNQTSTTVILPEQTMAISESLLVDVQSTLSNSTPMPKIVVDADVSQPPHICAETKNSMLEDGIDKHSDSVNTQMDVTFQDVDVSVEPSTVPSVVGSGLEVELNIDDSTSSASPPSPPNLYSAVDPAATLNSLPITSPTNQPSILAEREEPKPPIPHSLLADLTKIRHRYDDLQRSFRDCHLALESLKASLGPTSIHQTKTSTYPNQLTGNKPPELTLAPIIPLDVLHAAVSRLDDYTEDVRVEVEIRISDEEVLAKGYEVLLCVPGALYSSSASAPSLVSQREPQFHHHQSQFQSRLPSQTHSDYDEDDDLTIKEDTSSSIPPTQSELEIQIQTFITGTDPSVTKAREGFSKKLEDVQHDIAVLKRAIHDPDPEMMMSDGPSTTVETGGGGGGGWTSWIRSPTRPSTPFSACLGVS